MKLSLSSVIIVGFVDLKSNGLHYRLLVTFKGGKCPSWPKLRPTYRITEVKTALPFHPLCLPSNIIIA